MNAMLSAHRGAVKVPKEALLQIGAPDPTTTWRPIAHGVLVNALGNVLASRGLMVRREEYAVQRDGHILFGVLDLAWGETTEYSAALGLRTSNDKTFCIQIAIGLRVFVRDNLAFHGDLIALKRKHTAKLDLVEELTAAIRRYELGYGQYQRQVEFLQRTPWSPWEARERIYTAFARRIVPARLFHDVAHPYVTRADPCTAWEVLNSFTSALKKLKPSAQFTATVKLGQFFSQLPCVFPAP